MIIDLNFHLSERKKWFDNSEAYMIAPKTLKSLRREFGLREIPSKCLVNVFALTRGERYPQHRLIESDMFVMIISFSRVNSKYNSLNLKELTDSITLHIYRNYDENGYPMDHFIAAAGKTISMVTKGVIASKANTYPINAGIGKNLYPRVMISTEMMENVFDGLEEIWPELIRYIRHTQLEHWLDSMFIKRLK